jgi:uncharacterized protein YijF (DUF1287 family)
MMQCSTRLLATVLIALLVFSGCQAALPYTHPVEPSPVELIPEADRSHLDWVLIGAREEVERGTRYDASYVTIGYPGGDVDPGRGACTDVVVRAFRRAGIDLQVLIHEDMCGDFEAYPQNWGLIEPDPNIDHRRVPNQMAFFERYGQALTTETNREHLQEWHWGDIVYWRFYTGQEHCGIVSDRKNPRGLPLVIHNAGIAKEEDVLTRWQIIGHYRFTEGDGSVKPMGSSG